MPGGDGRMFEVLSGPTDVTFDHNTGFCPNAYMVSDGSPNTDFFSFTNNIVSHANYGFIGSGTGSANTTLAMYFNNNWTVTHNVDIGGSANGYPAGSFFPATITAVGFIDTSAGNFRLTASSPYNNAGTDGKDLGADMDSIESASTYTCDKAVAAVQIRNENISNSVFPNPADKYITIRSDGSENSAAMITLWDSFGQEILSKHSAQNTEKLNISDLPNGVYFFHMQSEGTSSSSKFLVQH